MTETPNTWEMIDFRTPIDESELLSDFLWSLGVVAIEERNVSNDTVILRTSMGANPNNAIETVRHAFPRTHIDRVEILRSVADTWREFAHPTWVNESVVLVPAWMESPNECTPIFIEPFDTFGLGNHPTTVLALRLALAHVAEGSEVFDLGCGSGVLAVALAKLKNSRVFVYDIASNAQQAVEHNCDLNSVSDVQWVSGIAGQRVDTVIANILAPVLVEYADSIQNAIDVGGQIILSGLRTEQMPTVVAHYAQCSAVETDELDGWTAVLLEKI